MGWACIQPAAIDTMPGAKELTTHREAFFFSRLFGRGYQGVAGSPGSTGGSPSNLELAQTLVLQAASHLELVPATAEEEARAPS